LEEKLYQRCIDARVQEDPEGYCKSSIVPFLSNLTLWRADTKLNACVEGGRVMKEKCIEEACSPCALTVGYIFAKYEKHVEMSIQTVFEQIS
jgi:hypothetical protein